jgi:hypothetical protein
MRVTGDLSNARFMAGLEKIPDTIEWKDPVWSHCEQVRGMWQNDKISSVLTLIGCTSNDKNLLACGDENGIIRLFSFPCQDIRVSLLRHFISRFPAPRERMDSGRETRG